MRWKSERCERRSLESYSSLMLRLTEPGGRRAAVGDPTPVNFVLRGSLTTSRLIGVNVHLLPPLTDDLRSIEQSSTARDLHHRFGHCHLFVTPNMTVNFDFVVNFLGSVGSIRA